MSAPSSTVQRVMAFGWPRSFPVVQFPNVPLLVALAASLAARALHGAAHDVARAVFFVGLAVWAYGELVRGVNWFRRLLGAAGVVYVTASLARALGA